jgi:hypothetical protein
MGKVHQSNINFHLLEVLVFFGVCYNQHQTNTCVWLQSINFCVSLLQINTNTSIQTWPLYCDQNAHDM